MSSLNKINRIWLKILCLKKTEQEKGLNEKIFCEKILYKQIIYEKYANEDFKVYYENYIHNDFVFLFFVVWYNRFNILISEKSYILFLQRTNKMYLCYLNNFFKINERFK